MLLTKKSDRPFKGEELLEPLIDFIGNKLEIDIRSSCRETKYAFGRMIYYNIALNKIDVTLPQVAKSVNRHHSSVVSAYKNCEQPLEDPLYSYIYALALEFVEDLYFGRKIAVQDSIFDVADAMKERIAYLERVIRDLTRGEDFGPYEKHEMAYRALSDDKRELFKQRVEPILKMI